MQSMCLLKLFSVVSFFFFFPKKSLYGIHKADYFSFLLLMNILRNIREPVEIWAEYVSAECREPEENFLN